MSLQPNVPHLSKHTTVTQIDITTIGVQPAVDPINDVPQTEEDKKKAEIENDWGPAPKYTEPEVPSWNEFTQATTFHGIKYIFGQSDSRFRRILWIVMVLGAISLFMIQVGERMRSYYNYETNVDVELVYPNDIKFPVVTICNQNSYRLTTAIRLGVHDYIDHVYSLNTGEAINSTDAEIDDLSMKHFVLDTAHQLHNFIDSCFWDGERCDLDKDFVQVITDLGVCYSFNSNHTGKLRKVSKEGSEHGLKLIVNLEQYEYMKGPQNDAGVKLLLHSCNDIPLMKDMGFAAAPGTHTLASVDFKESNTMEPPFGKCSKSAETLSVCKMRCRIKHVLKECGCIDSSMAYDILETNDLSICNFTTTHNCVNRISKIISQSGGDVCDCVVPCKSYRYTPSLSYTHLSKLNIRRLVLLDEGEKDQVKKEFETAMDQLQRVKPEITEVDERLMSNIIRESRRMEDTLSVAAATNANFTTFSDSVNVMNILGSAAGYMEHDYEFFGGKIKASMEQIYEVKIILGFEYRLRALNHFTPYDNNVFPLFTMFTSCLADGVDPNGGIITADNDSLIEYDYGSDSESSEEEHYRYDEEFNLMFQTFGSTNYDMRNRRPVFITDDCDEAILFSYSEISQFIDEYRNGIFEDLLSFKTWYEGITVLFPPDIMAQHVDNQQCLQNLDWLNTTGAEILDAYFDKLESYGSQIEYILASFVYGDEDRSGLSPAVDSLYITLSEINVILRTEHMKAVWTILKAPNVVLKDWWLPIIPDIIEDNSPTVCTWIFTELSALSELGSLPSILYSCFESSHEKLIETYGEFSELVVSTKTMYERRVKPEVAEIQKYVSEDIEKLALTKTIVSPRSIKVTNDFANKLYEIDEYIEKLEELIIKEKDTVMDLLSFPLNPKLPFISFYTMNLTTVGVELYKFKDDPNTGFNEDHMKENFTTAYIDTFTKHFETIIAAFTDFRGNLYDIHEELVDHWIEEREELEEFKRTAKMDTDFYMNNFIQIDIFYPELSYEVVQQRPAFELLSLFSEVGGFLGLLLGASILTVCELVDYISIACLKRFHKNKATSPAN